MESKKLMIRLLSLFVYSALMLSFVSASVKQWPADALKASTFR